MFTSTEHCPHCQCNTIRKSHRRLRDWPLSLFGFLPVRCDNCNARFYRRRPTRPAPQMDSPPSS